MESSCEKERRIMNDEVFERLREISKRLKKEYPAEKVILFGSYATGDATEDNFFVKIGRRQPIKTKKPG